MDASGIALCEEIEIRKDSPFFERANLLNDRLRDFLGELKELRTRHGVIGDDDPKEDGRFPVPIVPKRRLHADDFRRQRNVRDSSKKLCLLSKCPGYVHDFIIAYAKTAG